MASASASPSSVTSETDSYQEWDNPSNAATSDDNRATAVLATTGGDKYTEFLQATDFGFAIPTDATVDGIKFTVEKSMLSSHGADYSAYVVKGGTRQTTEDKKIAGYWASSDTNYDYGGESDLWGVSWSPSDINATGFGFALRAWNMLNYLTPTMRVDAITAYVYYTPAGGVGRLVQSRAPLTTRVGGILT